MIAAPLKRFPRDERFGPTAEEEGYIKRSPSVAKVLDARALQGSLPAEYLP
jgi:hypothetical protein